MRELSREDKEMRGTFEPSKEIEPVNYDEVARFYAPEGWAESAKGIFLDICRILRPTGYLQNAMYISIRDLASNEHFRREAELALMLDPTDKKALYRLDLHGKAVRVLCKSFGFTPLDVQKISVIKKDDSKTLSLLK